MRIAGPTAAPVRLNLPQPLVLYSRLDLNGLLLDRAAQAGVEIEKVRILGAERIDRGWTLRTRASSIHADFCVVATGAQEPAEERGN